MKVCILGNSVALRMRPPRNAHNDKTYAECLEDAGHDVRTVARAGTLLSDAFATLEDDVVSHFPDVIIVHYGVAEVCYRQTIRWINNRTIRNYYLNARFARPFVPATNLSKVQLWTWRALNGFVRRISAGAHLRWQWMSSRRFIETMAATISVLLKDTAAHVVVIGINSVTDRVERILPGSNDAIVETNQCLAEFSATQGSRVSYLNPNEFISIENAALLVPDGVHFSARGHQEMAIALTKHLSSQADALRQY